MQTPLTWMDYAPDKDSTTPGVVTDCNNVWPTEKGFRTMPALGRISNALQGSVLGMASALLIATPVLAGATADTLYIADSNYQFANQIGGIPNMGNRWRFTADGQYLVAVNGVAYPYYYSLATGQFALLLPTLGGVQAPISALCEMTDYNLILVPPNSQLFYSNLSATASWAPDAASQVYVNQLDSTAGNITAVHRLRSGVALYKQNALHFGTFTGGLVGWSTAIVSTTIGARGNECVVNAGDYHYILGPDDFWVFDGYNLNPIPNHIKEWFFNTDADVPYLQNAAGRFDLQNDMVFWHYPSKNASPRGSLDSYVCWYRRTGAWGFGRLNIDLPLVGLTGDSSQAGATTISGVALRDHSLYGYDYLNSSVFAGGCYITSQDFGDRHSMYSCNRIRPGFQTYPSTPSGAPAPVICTPLNQYVAGTTPVSNGQFPISTDGWINLVNTARLQRFRLDFYSQCEITQGDVSLFVGGEV